MIDLQDVSDLMYEFCEGVKVSNNGTHFLSRCPICGDSKKNPRKRRFNLDYNSGNPIYHCFNCEDDRGSGSFLQLYSFLNGITIEEAYNKFYRYDESRITKKLSQRKIEKIKEEIEYENFNWIKDKCFTIPCNLEEGVGMMNKQYVNTLMKFIGERKIPKEYDVFICYDGKYKGRIIIPVYNKNRDIIYFQARRIPGSDIEPKYTNPTLTKGNVILNKFRFDPEKYIITTEGLIDAFMIGKQGTSCIGSYVSEVFLKELFKINNKVILCFDNDIPGYKSMIKFMVGSERKGRKKNVAANKFNKKVRYFITPKQFKECKDINSIVEKYHIDDIYSMIVENSYSYEEAFVSLKTDRDLNKLFEKTGGYGVNENNKNRKRLHKDR